MPIRPENRGRYPKDWKLISSYIRQVRALGKCEWCGVANYARGYRDKQGTFIEHDCEEMGCMSECDAVDAGAKCITIVLTVAHVHDHSPENVERTNLAALCQRCRNVHDMPYRKQNRSRNRGELSLFS